jgi:hypothetical protein
VTKFYIDTSAHLERWAGSREKRAEIDELLADELHATSSHALREWKHITEHASAELLNAIEKSEDLSDLLVRLAQLPNREPKQVLRVLAMLTRGSKTLDATVRLKLRAFLRSGSRQRFNHRIAVVRDGSQCQLARNEVFRDRDGAYKLVWRCAKGDSICEQEVFVTSRENEYRSVGQHLAGDSPSSRPRDRVAGEAAIRASEVPRDGKGRACYGTLGDVSIGMECGSDETILTTDRSFDIIGPALGREVMRIPPSP